MKQTKKMLAMALVLISLLATAAPAFAASCTHPRRQDILVESKGVKYGANANDKAVSHLRSRYYKNTCVGDSVNQGCWAVLWEGWMGDLVEKHTWQYSPSVVSCSKCGYKK